MKCSVKRTLAGPARVLGTGVMPRARTPQGAVLLAVQPSRGRCSSASPGLGTVSAMGLVVGAAGRGDACHCTLHLPVTYDEE